MRSWLLIPVTLFLFAACKGKNTIPPGVLKPKQMQAVLWDVMRADQFLSNYVLNKDSSLNKVTESLKYYDQVFAIHQVTKEQFQESFSFYKDHPNLLKIIMDSLSQSPPIAPVQVEEPSPAVVEPGLIPDSSRPLQKPQVDTGSRLQKKKAFTAQ